MLERARLTTERMMAGTVFYMPRSGLWAEKGLSVRICIRWAPCSTRLSPGDYLAWATTPWPSSGINWARGDTSSQFRSATRAGLDAYRKYLPPLGRRHWPVTYPASSLARHTARKASSSGVPHLGNGSRSPGGNEWG